MTKVLVHDGSVEKALRKFKKKVAESGKIQEVRDRQQYTKPNVDRKLKKSLAKRRWKKYLRDQTLPKKLY